MEGMLYVGQCNGCDVRHAHAKGMGDQTAMPLRSKVVWGVMMVVTWVRENESVVPYCLRLDSTAVLTAATITVRLVRKATGMVSHTWAVMQFPRLVPHRDAKNHPTAPLPTHRPSLLHPHPGSHLPHPRRPAPI